MRNIILIFFILLLFFIININYDTFKNKDILIIEFIGGLGNQLFFLATAFEYAQKNKKHIIIKNKKNISSYGKNREFNKIIYRKFDIKDINIKNFNKIDELNLNKNIQGNVYLSKKYYYQNYKYFINSRKEFITKIYFCNKNTKNSLLKKYNINKNKKNICIHLRYSDTHTPEKWDGIYSEEELNKIINHCYENYKNENILIFSNDNNKNLNKFNNFKNVIFVNEEDYLELYLMSKCDIYYCSPSTFNWWGIYLNTKPEKVYLLWDNNTKIRNDLYKNYEYLGKNILNKYNESNKI